MGRKLTPPYAGGLLRDEGGWHRARRQVLARLQPAQRPSLTPYIDAVCTRRRHYDSRVLLVDTSSGEERVLKHLVGEGYVRDIRLSPTGKYLLVVFRDQPFELFTTAERYPVRPVSSGPRKVWRGVRADGLPSQGSRRVQRSVCSSRARSQSALPAGSTYLPGASRALAVVHAQTEPEPSGRR
jgi:hypothetical protein